jgi:hypothetical protein
MFSSTWSVCPCSLTSSCIVSIRILIPICMADRTDVLSRCRLRDPLFSCARPSDLEELHTTSTVSNDGDVFALIVVIIGTTFVVFDSAGSSVVNQRVLVESEYKNLIRFYLSFVSLKRKASTYIIWCSLWRPSTVKLEARCSLEKGGAILWHPKILIIS